MSASPNSETPIHEAMRIGGKRVECADRLKVMNLRSGQELLRAVAAPVTRQNCSATKTAAQPNVKA